MHPETMEFAKKHTEAIKEKDKFCKTELTYKAATFGSPSTREANDHGLVNFAISAEMLLQSFLTGGVGEIAHKHLPIASVPLHVSKTVALRGGRCVLLLQLRKEGFVGEAAIEADVHAAAGVRGRGKRR